MFLEKEYHPVLERAFTVTLEHNVHECAAILLEA
jgi:hypothetical protein